MTCITEIKMTCGHVHQADEHRHEHTVFIVFSGEGGIHTRGHLSRHHPLGGERTEQAGGLGHEQRGGHTLA